MSPFQLSCIGPYITGESPDSILYENTNSFSSCKNWNPVDMRHGKIVGHWNLTKLIQIKASPVLALFGPTRGVQMEIFERGISSIAQQATAREPNCGAENAQLSLSLRELSLFYKLCAPDFII